MYDCSPSLVLDQAGYEWVSAQVTFGKEGLDDQNELGGGDFVGGVKLNLHMQVPWKTIWSHALSLFIFLGLGAPAPGRVSLSLVAYCWTWLIELSWGHVADLYEQWMWTIACACWVIELMAIDCASVDQYPQGCNSLVSKQIGGVNLPCIITSLLATSRLAEWKTESSGKEPSDVASNPS